MRISSPPIAKLEQRPRGRHRSAREAGSRHPDRRRARPGRDAGAQRAPDAAVLRLAARIFTGFQNLLDARVEKKRQAAALVRLQRYVGAERGYEPIAHARAGSATRSGREPAARRAVDRRGRAVSREPAALPRRHPRRCSRRAASRAGRRISRPCRSSSTTTAHGFASTVLPRARKTNRLPPEIYADNLKNFGVDMDPHELMDRAQTAYAQTRDEMASRRARARRAARLEVDRLSRRDPRAEEAAHRERPAARDRTTRGSAQIEAIVRKREARDAAEARRGDPARDRGGIRRAAGAAPRPAAADRQHGRARGIRAADAQSERGAGRRDGRLQLRRDRLDADGARGAPRSRAAVRGDARARRVDGARRVRVQQRERRRLGALRRSRDEAVPAARRSDRRAADAPDARGARVPRSDAESRADRAGCRASAC